MSQKTAVLLLNTGSPSSLRLFDVARYLSNFLGDRRVISIPWFFRKVLVNGIIVPFRSFSAKVRYTKLVEKFDGKFPLPYYGERLKIMLQAELTDDVSVYFATRYGNPSIEEPIEKIIRNKYDRLIVLPLYPQYASSSTESVIEKVQSVLRKYPTIPALKLIQSFYDHPLFIKAVVGRVKETEYETFEQILFSYHSLPMSHIRTLEGGIYDYVEACRKTSELIARQLGLSENKYETTFQSQLSSKWQGPFTDKTVEAKAKNGIKSLLIIAPSFVADCLESSLELGDEIRKLFFAGGGEKYQLVESLNDSTLWLDCLKSLVSDE